MKRFLIRLSALVALGALAIILARQLFPLPDISGRVSSQAIASDPSTKLGKSMVEAMQAQPGKTGVILLKDGLDALASRLVLTRAAEHSIDSQYYIWHDDTTGILMLSALFEAAKRGVQVRLLLDDNGVPGLDNIMAALNAQDNFEIRLFNPSTVRNPKFLGYAFDFMRMNRRMHNKSFIVDGAAAIIGGRNIGDAYFEVGDETYFVDLDVLATGTVVPETATMFDDYWNSKSAFEVDSIIDGVGDIGAFELRVAAVKASEESAKLKMELRSSAERYWQGEGTLEWSVVQLVADDPVKGQGIATSEQLMITQLENIVGGIEQRVDLVSAYFIPGQRGTTFFTELAQSGQQVRILTNAANTTDVLMVHAGYSKYRRELLEVGIELYELKLGAEQSPKAAMQIRPFGVSGASLHAKTFVVDDKRLFIGSFNFDPRSAELNCEMGFLIDNPTLVSSVSEGFHDRFQTLSYRPELRPDGKLIWQEHLDDGTIITWEKEPHMNWFQRAAIVVMGWLPIEWLL